MSFENVVKLSLEWLLCKPLAQRTYAEFAAIVDHYAGVYGYRADQWAGVREAYMKLPDWQKPR